MESEKVKEIKKCLVFCKDRLCEDCPRLKQEPNQEEDCRIALIGQSLTLINELESENERLLGEKQKILEYMKTDNYAKLKKEDMYWGYQMGIGMLEHEIDRQKDRIAELEEYIKGNEQDAKAFVNGWHKDLKQELKLFVKTLKEKKPYFAENLVGVNAEHGWDMCIRVVEKTLKECLCDKHQ